MFTVLLLLFILCVVAAALVFAGEVVLFALKLVFTVIFWPVILLFKLIF